MKINIAENLKQKNVYLEGNQAKFLLSPSQERENFLKAQSDGRAAWVI